jgi:cytochrome c oxidase subunit 3
MEQAIDHIHEEHHVDAEGSKIGMWLFIFTEILLFGGLFVVYTVYRNKYPGAFHLAHLELDIKLGTINTIILLVSSATVAMSISAIQKSHKKMALGLLAITIILALAFLVNKYFEWTAKFHHGIYPGSEHLLQLSHGDNLFFTLYFTMTGIHALHIIVGLVLLSFVFIRIVQNKVNSEKYVFLENGGLYWHLVDLIWIFLFPLFYLIA